MRTIAILGSGDLAATLARRLAERELARRVVLIDADDGRARGKALDIAQSGPVEGFDCVLEGARELGSAGPADALVVADPAELGDLGGATPAPALLETVWSWPGSGPIVVAGAHPCGLVEAVVARGLPRARVLGSGPVAQEAALRRRLASELEVEPMAVQASVMGRPPHGLLAPQGSATVGGVLVERLSAVAMRRALAVVNGRAPGPVALAAAAARVLAALQGGRPSLVTVAVVLQGEYGHRGVALAVPARLAGGRLDGIVEQALEPVDRVALDNAARR